MSAATRACAAIALVLVLVAQGCDNSDTDCDAMTELSAPPSTPASAADVQRVLAQSCALGGCHLSAPGAGELVLDVTSAAWTDALVGAPAHEAPSMDLVTAGDPDRSWLVHKIFGSFCGAPCDPTLGCGAEMPFGAPLADADRETIVAWVIAGAPSR